jgi:hypothetical protein
VNCVAATGRGGRQRENKIEAGKPMPLISLREFARRNGVSDRAIGKAVKAGRLPSVDGKIDADEAQAVWDRIKDPIRAGRKLARNQQRNGASSQVTDLSACELGCEPSSQGTETSDSNQVRIQVRRLDGDQATPPTPAPSGCELQVRTQAAGLDGQVRSAISPAACPPPPTKGRGQIAITIPLNGAEEMELAKWSAEKGVSLPVYVLITAGYDRWRLEAARGRPERSPRRRPVRHGLERRSVTVVVNRAVFEDLWWRSAPTGLTLPQFIRTLLGFEVRRYSNPNTFERDHEFEDAWDRLLRLGFDPKIYMPAE